MAHELISKKTRVEFREFMTGWVLREIDDAFTAAGVECRTDFDPPLGGQRRSLVEQYYFSLNFSQPGDVRKLLDVYEYVLNEEFAPRADPITGKPRAPSNRVTQLIYWLGRDGYEYTDGRIVSKSGLSMASDVRTAALELDAPHLADTIRRIEAAIDDDPALAIGSAKELVESTCKTILRERAVTEDLDKLGVAPLVRRTAEELRLIPEAIPSAAKGVEAIRRLLGNLANVTQGLAEIRNLYGTGHGKEGKHRGLGPRHARLAVGAATTLAVFLLDTHRARAGT
jgi:hypothetical protein